MNKPTMTLLTASVLAAALPWSAQAANHREAPLTALDQKADITDFFAFVSYDDPTRVTLILDVDPLLEPSNGPNFFPFDPEILYEIKIDNDHDAREDITFQFRFNTEIRAPGVFTGFVGAGDGIPAPANSPAPVAPGTPLIPPAITALDGPGSEGLSLRQNYTVQMIQGKRHYRLQGGQVLYAVPSNAGPRTMPDYSSLAQQGVYDLTEGVRVFAGTVDDPFWIDLGAAFDSLNFRPSAFASGVPGVLSDDQDRDDTQNFASDDVAGFNVNAIAVEAPIALLTADGKLHSADDIKATIGAWGTTSRPGTKVLPFKPGGRPLLSRSFRQIQRMGNPLFNELIIGAGSKDKFSMSEPRGDAQFATFALDPLLARVLNAIYADALPIPTPPRNDLLPLVQYLPPIAAPGTPTGPVADLLRLNTGVPATVDFTARSRLGLLGGDPAGFPNGRRVFDDVTDISARVVAGVLAPPEGGVSFSGFPHNRIGDGVNTNDRDYQESFPYLAWAQSGRNSRHVDPDEDGCTGFCPLD
ncbi:MAG: DUF4331 domain-containing protein [Gammaproteobacteria bacterium]|nr:DUF4331 domain-containing protein [Gammaproteobacteria bacterium]MCP5423618.1 DUF4331 domain-containing protein [Gammaproteobacteria bacterium]